MLTIKLTPHKHQDKIILQESISEAIIVQKENIEEITKATIIGEINFNDASDHLTINAEVSCTIIAICANCSNKFNKKMQFIWNNMYYYNQEMSSKGNYLLDNSSFILEEHLIDEILMNTPINLSDKCDIILDVEKNDTLMSEKEYSDYLENKIDPRWNTLLKWKDRKE